MNRLQPTPDAASPGRVAQYPGHDEHDVSIYVPAALSGPHRKELTVGAGLAVDNVDGTRVFIHIVDDGEIDEDAYMSIDAAVDLVDALIVAISHGRTVLARTSR